MLVAEAPLRLHPKKKPTRHHHGPFCGHYSANACRWWMETIPGATWSGIGYGHFSVLLDMLSGGRSAEETEGLSHCFTRTVEQGARSASGRWCVCLSEESPSAGDARGSIGGDGIAALVAVRADLEHALDELPIGWTSVAGLFEIQSRGEAFRERFQTFRRGGGRAVDLEHEPIDPVSRRPVSRQLAWSWMSYVLTCTPGGDGLTCNWPGKAPVLMPGNNR